MNFRILNTIGEAFHDDGKKILEEIGTVDYRILTQVDLHDILPNYDVFLVGLGLRFHKSELERAKNLKVLATATTGLDHIDTEHARKKGVHVVSLRGENEFLDTISGTAELAWGLMTDLLRKIPWSFDSVKKGEWDRERFRGHTLRGRTLGIVGLGRLGKMMARYANAFNMNIVFCDPNVPESPYPFAKKVSFDELLVSSDVVTIHVHLTSETENLFDKKTFTKMKKGAYLINTSRGKIVNEDELIETLEGKVIAGYGTDVLSGELEFKKTFSNYPLVEYAKEHDNVIIAPHTGGMTFDSRSATDIFIAKKLRNFLGK